MSPDGKNIKCSLYQKVFDSHIHGLINNKNILYNIDILPNFPSFCESKISAKIKFVNFILFLLLHHSLASSTLSPLVILTADDLHENTHPTIWNFSPDFCLRMKRSQFGWLTASVHSSSSLFWDEFSRIKDIEKLASANASSVIGL